MSASCIQSRQEPVSQAALNSAIPQNSFIRIFQIPPPEISAYPPVHEQSLLIMNQNLAFGLLFCFSTLVRSIILDPRDVDAPFLACYDYIICGKPPSQDVDVSQIPRSPTLLLTQVQVVGYQVSSLPTVSQRIRMVRPKPHPFEAVIYISK